MTLHLSDLTTTELVDGFNTLTGSSLKRFASRDIAFVRIDKALTETGKTEAEFVALARPEVEAAPVHGTVVPPADAARTPTFDLTDNEMRALCHLVAECLAGIGGRRPADLAGDPYTWCSATILVERGWSKESAGGTYASLIEKGAVEHYAADSDVVADDAWRWLDTRWDALAEAEAKAAPDTEAASDSTDAAPPAAETNDTPANADAKLPRPGTKRAAVLDAALRPDGVTVDELRSLTGWPSATATLYRVITAAGYAREKVKRPTGETAWRAISA